MDQQVGVLAAKPDNLNSNLRHTHTHKVIKIQENTKKLKSFIWVCDVRMCSCGYLGMWMQASEYVCTYGGQGAFFNCSAPQLVSH